TQNILRYQSSEVRLIIAQLMNNVIDIKIKYRSLTDIDKYIDKQNEILQNYPSQQYSTLLKFHEMRLTYLNKPTRKNIKPMEKLAEFYNLIEYAIEAEGLELDIEQLLNPSNNKQTSLLNAWQ
ncbi:MAG: hypothetical protein ACK5LT_13730, partial [Lachnospirales bacterium]